MFALDVLHMPLAPLRLLLDAQRLRLGAENAQTTLVHALVDVGRALERVVARAQDGGAVEAEDVARFYVGHEEGQSEVVAFREEVWPVVQVGGDVVRALRVEVWQLRGEGGGDFEGGLEDGWEGEFVAWDYS